MDDIPNWVLTIGVLIILALIFAGVDLVGAALLLIFVGMIINATYEAITKRKKRKQ